MKNDIGILSVFLVLLPTKIKFCPYFFYNRAAGHETTGHALAWSLYYVAKFPEIYETLRKEVCPLFEGSNDRMLPFSQVNKLDYTRAVIRESLRLKGPSFGTDRILQKEMKVNEFVIPKGSCIFVPFHVITQDKAVWGQDAAEFKPERFLRAHQLPLGFLPFSTGSR